MELISAIYLVECFEKQAFPKKAVLLEELTVLSLNLAYCSCYVAYEIFHGFDVNDNSSSTTTTSNTHYNATTTIQYTTPGARNVTSTVHTPLHTTTIHFIQPIVNRKFLCPEHEKPLNIGAYEVPTQRDIVFHVRTTLTRLFNSYHEKALFFLKDIKEATKGTAAVEKACHGYGTDRPSYKKCVMQVSTKCELITKGLVKALESQRRDVSAFTSGTVCNVKGLEADPMVLIKTLAMEEASIEFALPGYLRLLSACSVYCDRMEPQNRPKKPLRHMTDQDLVVKHFLTKKNYIQLLKGSK